MRIVHLLQEIRLSHGGIVRAVLDLSALMAARGHEVVILTHDAADAPQHWTGRGTPLIAELGPIARRGRRMTPAQRDAALREVQTATALHLHGAWNPANLALAAETLGVRVPYVVSPHGMLDDWSMAQRAWKKRLFLALGGRRFLERAARVHCTAQAELDQARRWFPRSAGRAVVAPLAFDLTPFRAAPDPGPARAAFAEHLRDGEPLLLFLARLHYKKGPDIFLRTIAELGRRGVACRAILAGTADPPGYEHELQALAASEGIADRVGFVGMVTGDLKHSLYALADVFCAPTSQENFGYVFPECLACGTPLITTRGVDIHPELAASGGAVLTERTPAAFADAAESLIGDPGRRAAMGGAGRAWVLDWLDPARLAGVYESMYAGLGSAGV